MTAIQETCELVRFRFDSSQRKNNVLIYDSQRFPGKSSEWYFVRRNQTTQNETYRCVHCRAAREKVRRAGNNATGSSESASNPGARIIVRGDYFTVSPDFPLGEHICDFEVNENCNTHTVWSRRALLRANSELRLNPERPKLKFEKLLQLIENGENEYAHLSEETRTLIIGQLTSKNGFDSRRRSFARNNSFGFRRMQRNLEWSNEEPSSSIFSLKSNHIRRKMQRNLLAHRKSVSPVVFACGMPYCKLRFANETDRAQHRSICHPEMLFLDSYEQYEEYKRIVNEKGGPHEEIIVTDNGEIVKIDTCNVSVDSKRLEFVDELSLNNVECEVVCSSLSDHNLDLGSTQFASTSCEMEVADGTSSQLDSQCFLNRVDDMLSLVRDYAKMVENNPIRRDEFQAHVQDLVNTCQEFAYSNNLVMESSLPQLTATDQDLILVDSKNDEANYSHNIIHDNTTVVQNYTRGRHQQQLSISEKFL